MNILTQFQKSETLVNKTIGGYKTKKPTNVD